MNGEFSEYNSTDGLSEVDELLNRKPELRKTLKSKRKDFGELKSMLSKTRTKTRASERVTSKKLEDHSEGNFYGLTECSCKI